MATETNPNAEATEAWDGPLFDRFLHFKDILIGPQGIPVFGEKAFALYPPPPGTAALDLGCGFGDATSRLADLVGRAKPGDRGRHAATRTWPNLWCRRYLGDFERRQLHQDDVLLEPRCRC